MTLRDFISLLFPMRTHLQEQLRQQHEDFLRLYDIQNANHRERLIEKDAEIRRLRGELANSRVATMPERPRITDVTPIEASGDWQDELNKMLAEEETRTDAPSA